MICLPFFLFYPYTPKMCVVCIVKREIGKALIKIRVCAPGEKQPPSGCEGRPPKKPKKPLESSTYSTPDLWGNIGVFHPGGIP